MPYTMRAEGLKELEDLLNHAGEHAEAIAGRGLYDGAGAMADEIKRQVKNIKTEPFWYAQGRHQRMPSPEEKEIVMNADTGIAKFDKNGAEVQTSVGFSRSGYAILKNKTVPIPLIANAINSGTSFMKKQPFFRKAVSAGRKKAVSRMKETMENEWSRFFNEENGGK